MKGWKEILFKWRRDAGGAIYTQIDFKTKTNERRALHCDKWVNPTRRYNICKYAPNTGAPKYRKQILKRPKREN